MNWTSVEVIKSSKPSSLLNLGINYGRKNVYCADPWFSSNNEKLVKNADFVKIQFS
jgi:hypothetical protein